MVNRSAVSNWRTKSLQCSNKLLPLIFLPSLKGEHQHLHAVLPYELTSCFCSTQNALPNWSPFEAIHCKMEDRPRFHGWSRSGSYLQQLQHQADRAEGGSYCIAEAGKNHEKTPHGCAPPKCPAETSAEKTENELVLRCVARCPLSQLLVISIRSNWNTEWNFPVVNSIKNLRMWFTSWTLVSIPSNIFWLSKSLYKSQIQVFKVQLQWHLAMVMN